MVIKTETKYSTVLDILKTSIKQGVSYKDILNERELSPSYINDYIYDIKRGKVKYLNEDEKNEVVKLFESQIPIPKTSNNKSLDLNNEVDFEKRSKCWQERDEDGKILRYHYEIHVRDEKPLEGYLTRQEYDTIVENYPFLTRNTVSQMFPTLTFVDFKRIIRCFNITKDVVFSPHTLEENPPEKIAEFHLKAKAKSAYRKITEERGAFNEKVIKDLVRENLDLKDIRTFIDDTVNKYIKTGSSVKLTRKHPEIKTGDIGYLFYSDIHYGKKYESPIFGRGCDKDILHDRMIQIADETIKYVEFNQIKKLKSFFAGDIVESILEEGMHPGHFKEMDLRGDEQIMFAIDSQINFIQRILDNTTIPLEFTFIGGNHDRIGDDRQKDKARTASLLIFKLIKKHFQDNERVVINVGTNTLTKDNENGLCVLMFHGDNSLIKKQPHELVNLHGIGTTGYHLVVSGHFHSGDIKQKTGTNYMSISLPSVCSTDNFVLNELGNNDLPGFVIGKKQNSGFSFNYNILH